MSIKISTVYSQISPLARSHTVSVLCDRLERLFRISQGAERAKARGGIVGGLQRAAWSVAGLATFARLYVMPVKPNQLPVQVRVAPAW